MGKSNTLDNIKKYLKELLKRNKTLFKFCVSARGNIIYPWVKFHQNRVYKKLVRIYQRQERKIRVGFFVTENEKWCCQTLFDKLKQSSSFEPVIVLSSLSSGDPVLLQEKFQRNLAFFKKICPNLIIAYDNEKHIFHSLKSYKIDIIFYQQPWEIAKEQNILATCKFALPCYEPYCFEDGVVMLRVNFYKFHRLLFREYVNHPSIKEDYIKAGFSKDNIQVVGCPKFEAYLQPSDNCPKKYVIYAPHHSIAPNSIRLGTFAWNGHFMLEYAKKHPEFKWIFKPHPRCKTSFLEEGVFKNRKELEAYYKHWASIGEVCETGNYIDLFKQTKCLITDCSSFLVEFLPTKQPLIHLKRVDDNATANVAKKACTAYYPVFDLETLKKTLHMVLEEGKDPMCQARLDKLNELQLVQPAADNIIKDLQNSLSKKDRN